MERHATPQRFMLSSHHDYFDAAHAGIASPESAPRFLMCIYQTVRQSGPNAQDQTLG
jgi:hypothetical protein